jgi:hypothetical protein
MPEFDLSNPSFFYGDILKSVVEQVLSTIPTGIYDGSMTQAEESYVWDYPIDPDVWFEYWEDEGRPFFDVDVVVEPQGFASDHPGWNIKADAGWSESAGGAISVTVQLRPTLEITPELLEEFHADLANIVPHEMHHLTQEGQPFQRPNCPVTPSSSSTAGYEYFSSACEVPAFLIGFRSESAHRGQPIESLMQRYLDNYVRVGDISSKEAEDIKSSWLEHEMWTNKTSLAESLLVEKSLTGNKLDSAATHVADVVIEYLLDEDLRAAFASQGGLGFTLELELPASILWLRDVYVRLHPADDFNSTAAYEFDLDASDAQREASDMQLNLYMPQDYSDDELKRLHVEIESDARHELEHSGQLTSVLMDVQKKVPDSEIWKTIQRAEDYYTSEAEVPAHVASLVLKSKRRDRHGADEVDQELNNIYHTGLKNGYSEEELGPLMTRMRDIWQYYLMSRWPEQDWPIEFRPESEREDA